MRTTKELQPAITMPAGPPAGPTSKPSRPSAQRAAWIVAGTLAALVPLNTYWGFGGRWGMAWVVGGDCEVPLALVWIQQVALVIGIGVVLVRVNIVAAPFPMLWKLASWMMAVAFGAVGLHNLLGDNSPQARLLFAPVALLLAALCVVVARRSMPGVHETRVETDERAKKRW